MSKWIAFFISLVASFIMAASAYAQETPEAVAQKYDITFPIAGFGNCQDYASCHAFCEDPVNIAVCKAYFKAKGVYTEESKDQIISAAKGELGCDSKESCEVFCQSKENQDKCDGFVSKHRDKLGIKGGYVKDPAKFVSVAKQALGCDSKESCLSFCAQEENRQKCDEFKSQVGCRGGIEHKGPGGCNSEDTCQAFCSDPSNFAECSNFAPPSDHPDKQGHFKGPGGCDSEEACRAYCEQNPQQCKIVAVGGAGLIDPTKTAEEYKKFCQVSPDKCAAKDANPFASTVARTEFERFCEANPEKCGGGHEKQFEQARKAEFSKLCQENPQKCQTGPGGYQIPQQFHSEGGFIDPGDWCQKYPDRCTPRPYPSWTPYPSYSPYPYPTYSPQPNYTPQPYPSYSPAASTFSTPAPSQTPTPTTSTSTPAPEPVQSSTPQPQQFTPAPEPSGAGPVPSPQVHGIFTTPSLIDQLLNFFR